ncbi:uncharacterized protein EV154DRAFT_515149 [Mucor mucedo]|uniref:uncharacterized protein n=1 Tax=Mucor mucedo TaxID=29922 RepID=UPI00222113B0|nr:uncharacterized protein EV154DRAFT_515149 [Mucor mucedo]KAI7889299.1 hypothetical protein EV154DRAFT_515149 [Mucor mucedo]
MTNEIATKYSSQIISTITALEDQLKDITNSQNELLDAILKAQATCITEQELADIKKMMDKVSIYNTKLLSIKATMSMLTGRTKQLQAKADKLKQIKTQYLSQIDQIRKMEQEKDQAIAAVTSSPTISSPVQVNTPTASASVESIPKIKSIVKKKKKSKAREVLIGDDSSSGNWAPKKSLSQMDLLKKT